MVVRLDTPRQLFEALHVSPLTQEYTEFTAQPAIVTIRDLLLMRKPRKRDDIELVIVLPDHEITPTLDEELTVAVRRWVRVQNIMESESSEAGGAVGRRLFFLGLVLFLVLQTAAIYLRNYSDATDNDPLAAVAEGISVTSWVMLWFPIQTFTVEVWRNTIRRGRATAIERMRVITVPASAEDSLE